MIKVVVVVRNDAGEAVHITHAFVTSERAIAHVASTYGATRVVDFWAEIDSADPRWQGWPDIRPTFEEWNHFAAGRVAGGWPRIDIRAYKE